MKIHKLVIQRIREIESLTIDCEDTSMIAIVGENGTGKTTVLFSLLFAITGVLILKGTKEEHVRDVGDGPSWVEIIFTHMGSTFKLRRHMDSSACTLTITDSEGKKESIKGLRKAALALEEAGIFSHRVLQAFLPQGDADKLFKALDAERASEALKTFGLSQIESLSQSLSEATSMLTSKIDHTLAERHEIATSQLELISGRQASTNSRYEAAEADNNSLKDAQKILQHATDIRIANEQYTKLNAVQESAQAEQGKLSKQLRTVSGELDLAKEDYSNIEGPYNAAKEALYAHDQFLKSKERRDEAATGVTEATLIRAGADSKRTKLIAQLLPEEVLSSYEDTILRADDQLSTLRQAKNAEMQLAKVTEDGTILLANLQAAQDRVAPMGELSVLEGDLEQFRGQLAIWSHQAEHTADGKCSTCGQAWAGAVGSDLPADIAKSTAVVAKISQLITERRAADSGLAQSQQSVDIHEKSLAVMQENYNGMLAQLESIVPGHTGIDISIQAINAEVVTAKNAVTGNKKIAADIDICTQDIAVMDSKLVGLQAVIESLSGSQLDAGAQQTSRELITACEAKKSSMQAKSTECDITLRRVDTLRLEIDSRAAEIQTLLDQLGADDKPDTEIKSAEAFAMRADDIQSEWMSASDERSQLSSQYELFNSQVESLAADMRKQAATQKKLDIIAGARHILHRDQLPLFVCSLYTELVSQQWAIELENFGCKFTAWQDASTLEFYARFENGRERRVYQLSGGERQSAIVAYLFVINRLFSPDLNIIGFDEPTTHIDAAMRPAMVEVFRRMAERADEEGMQIFIVDHALEFLTAFPAAVHLEKHELIEV